MGAVPFSVRPKRVANGLCTDSPVHAMLRPFFHYCDSVETAYEMEHKSHTQMLSAFRMVVKATKEETQMDTNIKDVQRLEVDDIDDEVYYREMLGCTARLEGTGEIATVNCGQGEFQIAQKPGSTERRMASEPCSDCDEC